MRLKELTNSTAIRIKGALFLLLGLLSAGLLLLERPSLKVALLLVIAIWSFCRFYYFAFYVIERYLDSKFRFSGLFSTVRYLMEKKNRA